MRGGMARVMAVKRETNNGRDSDGAERPWCKERGKGRERERERKSVSGIKRGAIWKQHMKCSWLQTKASWY